MSKSKFSKLVANLKNEDSPKGIVSQNVVNLQNNVNGTNETKSVAVTEGNVINTTHNSKKEGSVQGNEHTENVNGLSGNWGSDSESIDANVHVEDDLVDNVSELSNKFKSSDAMIIKGVAKIIDSEHSYVIKSDVSSNVKDVFKSTIINTIDINSELQDTVSKIFMSDRIFQLKDQEEVDVVEYSALISYELQFESFNHENHLRFLELSDHRMYVIGYVASVNGVLYNTLSVYVNKQCFSYRKKNLILNDNNDIMFTKGDKGWVDVFNVRYTIGNDIFDLPECFTVQGPFIIVNISNENKDMFYARAKYLVTKYNRFKLVYVNKLGLSIFDFPSCKVWHKQHVSNPMNSMTMSNKMNNDHDYLASIIENTIYKPFLDSIWYNGKFKTVTPDYIEHLGIDVRFSRSREYYILLGSVLYHDGWRLLFIKNLIVHDNSIRITLNSIGNDYRFILRGDRILGGLKGYGMLEYSKLVKEPCVITHFNPLGGFMSALVKLSEITCKPIFNYYNDDLVVPDEININLAARFVFNDVRQHHLGVEHHFNKTIYYGFLAAHFPKNKLNVPLLCYRSTGVLFSCLYDNISKNITTKEYPDLNEQYYSPLLSRSTSFVDSKLLLDVNASSFVVVNVSHDYTFNRVLDKDVYEIDVTDYIGQPFYLSIVDHMCKKGINVVKVIALLQHNYNVLVAIYCTNPKQFDEMIPFWK